MDIGSPTLVSLNDGNARTDWTAEARPNRSRNAIACLCFTLVGATGIGATLFGAGPLGLWIGGWSALFAVIAWRFASAGQHKNDWAVRAGPDEVLVNLRSFYNHQLDPTDPVVAILPASCIRSMVMRLETGFSARLVRSYVQEFRVRRSFLDIEIAGDLSKLYEELAREGERWVSKGRLSSRVRHVPVTLIKDTIVRVVWEDETTHLRPSIHELGAMLARWYPLTVKTGSDVEPIATQTPEQQEERLRKIASSGRFIPAIALAKRLHGFSTVQAKRFIEAVCTMFPA